ncbi:uncharacterized protein LOC134774584 isoform X1 [Penaeus indicus]|uniref:uncharacterized protein LOC134774584 isoform X1 n=1 Tax=Penaeus indicus TaxID=29960 RepID=UPI00300C942A
MAMTTRRWAWAAVFLAATGVVCAAPSDAIQEDYLEIFKKLMSGDRDEEFLDIEALLKCSPNATSEEFGICLPLAHCANTGGVPAGTCARGFGVCCIAQRTCGESTSYTHTNFVNPGYYDSDTGSGACTLTVNHANKNICQIRLDFLELELAQPDTDGNCNIDFLAVTGGASTVPTICGSNSGQHMYIDVDPTCGALKVTVDRSPAPLASRWWNIKVTQIPCDSEARAPTGCLQYYTETSGYVKSFNFDSYNSFNYSENSQIAQQNYGVCIKAGEGYCGIMWERMTVFGFTVSGNLPVISPSLVGTAAASSTGATCTTDYVIIPGGVDNNQNSEDRFCGLGFPDSVTSTMKPFVMYVHTDADESSEVANRGFGMQYRQITDCC